MNFKYIKEVNDNIGIQMVKFYDKTTESWEEGMLCEKISSKTNMWKVYFPSTFTKDGYFLAIEVKEGEPQKDYCAYRINYDWK